MATKTYRVGPKRKVVEHRSGEGRSWDVLSCGHIFVWDRGDPRTGWGGTWPAETRLCRQCGEEHNAKLAPKD